MSDHPEPIELTARLKARDRQDMRSTRLYVTLTAIFASGCLAILTYAGAPT